MPKVPGGLFTERWVRHKAEIPATGDIAYFERLKKGRSLLLRCSYGGQKSWKILHYVSGKPRAHWPAPKEVVLPEV